MSNNEINRPYETLDYLLENKHPAWVGIKISAALHRNRVHVGGTPLSVTHFFLGMIAALQQSSTLDNTHVEHLFITCHSDQITLAIVQRNPAVLITPQLRIVAFGAEKDSFTIGG